MSLISVCGTRDGVTGKPCTGPHPCPIHQSEAWWVQHGNFGPDPELHPIGGVGGDNDTYEVHTGPLSFDVMHLRDQGVKPTVIAALFTDLMAVYRRWERRELKGPMWAVVGRQGWLADSGTRDKNHEDARGGRWERRGLFTDNVDLAQRFDSLDEIPQWIEDLDLFHPDHPKNLERVGLRVVRVL